MAMEINNLADLEHEVIDISTVSEDQLEFRALGRPSARYILRAEKGKLVLEKLPESESSPLVALSEMPVPPLRPR